jgi:hypothetical protein
VRRTGILALAVGAAAAGGCSSAHAPACPGEPVAVLHFSGARVGGDACPSIGAAAVSFTATLSWDGDTGALLCPAQPEAQPLRGTRRGNHVVVSAPPTSARAPTCACAVDVAETLEGDLLQADGAPSFTGTLRDDLAAAPGADPATCQAAGSTSGTAPPVCGVPCEIEWQVTGAP